MNGLELFVLGVIAVCGLIGYHTGFLRAVYSLFAGILLLVFVTWATPQVTVFLEKNTDISQIIKKQCENYIEKLAQEKIASGAEAYQNELPSDSDDVQNLLPPELLEEIAGFAAGAAGAVLEEAGLYEEIAGVISHYIIEGISFLIMMTAGWILMRWIAHVLDLAARFPALKGPDKLLGTIFGLAKGLLFVWIVFFILALLGGGGITDGLLSSIEKSRILSALYHNNAVLWIIMRFMD